MLARALVLLAGVGVAGCARAPAGDTAEPVVLELRTEGSRTAFLPDTLSVAPGARVTLRVVNEGEIAHNLVVVADEESVQPIVLAAYQSIATEYVPTGFDEAIVASTPLAYPGDTVEVSFTMPDVGGYTFVCVFPGHGSTMRGAVVATP
jgi:plastocyanin